MKTCQFCGGAAHFDGPTRGGPWAFMCTDCLGLFGRPTSTMNYRLR